MINELTRCADAAGTAPRATTTAGPGIVTALAASLPSSGPADQRGNLGPPSQLDRFIRIMEKEGAIPHPAVDG
ncbi:hypothetical protein ACFWUZ_34495 [Streptomyces sp. NPDC058646]|uniref:hypothetical protein n=1 Tax=Streptomyces sp. NPDC058646 TaxID=3346574 RepID=UPI0036521AB2